MAGQKAERSLPWIRVQDLLAWFYLYPLRYLSYLVPPRVACRLADRVSPLYPLLRPRMRSVVERQIVKAAVSRGRDLDASHRARAWMQRDFRKAIDDLFMTRFSIEPLSRNVRIDGLHHLDEALSGGKGVIVVSGHFHGNRLAKYYLRRRGYSLMSVRNRMPKNRAMGRFGNRFVAPAYGRFLNAIVEDEIHLQDSGVAAGMLRRLRENGLVNLHIDYAFATHSCWVPFLGGRVRMANGFVQMAALTGAAVVPMLCRGNSSALRVRFEPPMHYSHPLEDGLLERQIEHYRRFLEDWVGEYPEEWELWPRHAASSAAGGTQ